MKDFDFRGVAALVIAASAAVGLFVVLPLAILFGLTMGEIGSQVVVALGGALVGCLATYMGMKDTKP